MSLPKRRRILGRFSVLKTVETKSQEPIQGYWNTVNSTLSYIPFYVHPNPPCLPGVPLHTLLVHLTLRIGESRNSFPNRNVGTPSFRLTCLYNGETPFHGSSNIKLKDESSEHHTNPVHENKIKCYLYTSSLFTNSSGLNLFGDMLRRKINTLMVISDTVVIELK